MVRLVVLMMAGWLTGCTQAQRFALEKNAELDACAMKRMTETKISGEQGYLQAHHECHRIVMVQKFSESSLLRESLFLRKIVLGIRAQAIGKNLTRLINACGAPAVLLLSFHTQQGV
jgi:hypothetical protein